MNTTIPSVLIIDEAGFSRVCSAFIETEGFQSRTHTEVVGDIAMLPQDHYCLIVTSFPHAVSFSAEIKKLSLPTIILADHLSDSLLNLLEDIGNSFCMLKPLDYSNFKLLVRQIINGEKTCLGGYEVV
jgi:hypothetical protein